MVHACVGVCIMRILLYLAAATCCGVGEGGGGTSSAEVPAHVRIMQGESNSN